MADIFETLLGKLDLVFEINFNNNWEITFEQYEELYALNPNLNDEYVTYILDECIKDTKNLLSSSSSAIIWGDDQNNMKSGLNLLSLYIQIPILLLKHDTSIEITLNNIMIAIKSASLYLKLICLDGSQIYNVYQIQIINKIVLMLNSVASIILHFDDAQHPKKSKPHHHASQELVSNKKKSKTIKYSQPATSDIGAQSGLSKHHLTLSSESGYSFSALFACLNELIESWEFLYTIFPWSKFGCHYGFTMFTKLLTFAFKTLENCGPALKNLKHNHPTQDMMQNFHGIQKDIKSPQVLWKTINESIFKVLDASIKDVSAQSPNQDILIFKEQMEKLFFHLLQQMLIKVKGYKSSTINLTSLNQLTFDYSMDLCDKSTNENKGRQAVVQECLYRLCQHLTVASTSPEPGHLDDASPIDSQQLTGKEFYGRLVILVDTRLDNESRVRYRIWLARISKANKTSYKMACADFLHYTMSRQKQFSLQDPNENSRGNTHPVNDRESYYLSPEFLFRIALSSCEDSLAGVRNKSISSTIKYLEALSDQDILKQLTLCDLPSNPIECSRNGSDLPARPQIGAGSDLAQARQGPLVSGPMLRCTVQLEKMDLVSNFNESIKITENVVKRAISNPTPSDTILTVNLDQTHKSRRSNMISFSDLSKADCLTAYNGPGEGVITFQHLFALLRCRIKQDPKAHVRRVAVEALEKLMIRLLQVVQSPSNVAGINNSALLGTLYLATKSNVVNILSTAATSDKSVMVQKQALSSLTTLLSELAKIGLGSNGLEINSQTLPALKRMRASLEKAWIQALLLCSSLAVLQDKCCEIFDRIILRNLKPVPPSKASDQHSSATENDFCLALGILKNFVDLVYPINIDGDTNPSEHSQETQPYSVLRNLFSSLLAASIKSRLIAAQTTPPCSNSAGPSGPSQSNKTKAQHRITSSKRDGHSAFWRTLVSTLESFVMSPYDKVAWFMLALVCQLKPDLYCPEALFGPKTKSAPLSTLPVSTFDKLVTNQPYPDANFKTIDVIGHWNWISQAMISNSTPHVQLNFPFQPQPCTMIDVLSVLRCFVTCRCDAIAKNRILSALEAGLEPAKSNGGDLPHNLLTCLSSFSWPTFALCSALVETFKALVHVAACSETDNDSSDEADSLVGSGPQRDSPPPPIYVWQRLSNQLRDVLRTALNNVRTYVLTGSLENQQFGLGSNPIPLDVTKLSKYIFFMGECVLAFPNFLTKSLYNTILCLIIDTNAQPSEGENEDQNFRKSFLTGRQRTRTNYSFQHISRRSEKDLHNDDSSFSSQESSLNLETGEATSPEKSSESPKTKEKNIESQTQPSNVRSHAFLALGKFCLVNESLAKKSLPALIWELDTSRNEMVQNSIMIILMDFIKRYPNATDPYIPVILAICLHPSHSSPLTRYQCLSSFLRLLKEAFVPWNKMLFLKLITLCVDPNLKIRSLACSQLVPFIASVGADGQARNRRAGAAHHKGCGTVGNTNPFYNYFLDTVFFLNAFSPGHNASKGRAGASSTLGKYQALKPENAVFAMAGIENFDKRLTIYNIYLEHLKDDQKFLLTARICSDIFAPIADKSTNFPWDDTMHNVLRDAFSVLTSPSIQLSILSTTRKPSVPGAGIGGGGGEEEPEEEGVTQDPNTQQRVMEETRKGLVTQILKKNVVENILPILLTLKRFLEKLKSPLLKDLRSYLLWIAKSFPDEVEEVFATQPELAEDMEYHSKRDQILKRMSQTNQNKK